MKIELKKWSIEDKESLIRICNTIDRNYLSDRLPNPYTNESAEWWLNIVKENEGKTGIFYSIWNELYDSFIHSVSVSNEAGLSDIFIFPGIIRPHSTRAIIEYTFL